MIESCTREGVTHLHSDRCYQAGRRDVLTSDGSVELTCKRYSFPSGTGVYLAAGLGYPVVYANDRGYVEFEHYRIPAADFIAWARAVANAVEAREDAK